MVRTIEKELDRVTGKLFLLSVKKWHNTDGLHMGIESVSNLFDNEKNKNKKGIAVKCSILQDMPKCRVRKIRDGKLVMKENDEGEEVPAIEVVDDVEEVTFFFNVSVKGLSKEQIEKGEFKVNNKSSCFPLFNWAFITTGDLPEGNEKGFIADIDELKEALIGLEFLGKEKDESFSGGKKYQVLIPEDIPLKKETVKDAEDDDDDFDDDE